MRKGYSCGRMFNLSINNKVTVSIYIIKLSLSLWHDLFAHFSFKSLKYIAKH